MYTTVCVIHGYLKKGTYAVWIAYHHLVLNFIPSALSCFWNDVCCLSLEDCHYVSWIQTHMLRTIMQTRSKNFKLFLMQYIKLYKTSLFTKIQAPSPVAVKFKGWHRRPNLLWAVFGMIFVVSLCRIATMLFNVREFGLFWSQELDPAPGSYSWIPCLSNRREFQKFTI